MSPTSACPSAPRSADCHSYTFFCAFEPSQRPTIGQLYSRLVKPGGLLLALQFPLGEGEPGAPKPPYPVSQQAYDEAFGPHFECVQALPSWSSLVYSS